MMPGGEEEEPEIQGTVVRYGLPHDAPHPSVHDAEITRARLEKVETLRFE